jgi:nucleotide-binding universal stress UspA family protein
MKKILIALDYGLSAQKIAEKGLELAKSMNARVTLLHVVADETYYSSIDSAPFMGFYGYDFFNMADSDNLIESSLKFLDKIKRNLKDTEIETLAEQGDFPTVILETAARLHSNIIVLGSHSKNWLERTVMGNVTESVLAKTNIPMFIIPIKEHK